jgi:hypothetical protein
MRVATTRASYMAGSPDLVPGLGGPLQSLGGADQPCLDGGELVVGEVPLDGDLEGANGGGRCIEPPPALVAEGDLEDAPVRGVRVTLDQALSLQGREDVARISYASFLHRAAMEQFSRALEPLAATASGLRQADHT